MESILILNKWVLQAKTPGSIVPPPHGQVDTAVGFKPKAGMRKIESREEKKTENIT